VFFPGKGFGKPPENRAAFIWSKPINTVVLRQKESFSRIKIMEMKVVKVFALLFAGTALAGPIEDLKPGEWYEVPNSHLEDVKAPSSLFPWVNRGERISGIMNDWAGGAFDTKRDWLYVGPGGGHNGYFGNEVYAFDLNTLNWRRLTDPQPIVIGGCPDPTKFPCAIHSYDGLEYIPPPVDRYMYHGRNEATFTYLFDPEALKWGPPTSAASTSNLGINQISAYSSLTNTVWVGKGVLKEFNPVTKTWGRKTEYDNGVRWGRQVLTFDSKRNLLVAVGHLDLGGGNSWETVVTWDVSKNSVPIKAVKVLTTGATEILSGGGEDGVEYDPVADKVVAWMGGPAVYALDMDTKVWTKKGASNGVDPGPRGMNGTFGRFRYSPNKNVFVVANSVNRNVFLYRHTGGTPISVETTRGTLVAGRIYPNPARAGAEIHFPGADITKVFNPAGQRVFSGKGVWKTAGEPSGIYLVQGRQNGRTVSKRILLQN